MAFLSLVLSRYLTAGTAWFNGAFSKVAKVGQVAGTKTREKFHLAVSNLTAKVGWVLVMSPDQIITIIVNYKF